MPTEYGIIPVCTNILLLVVEVFGFVESLILYRNLIGMKKHPLPEIPENAYPDVDIFIATYNEPTELLRRTVNGCKHIKYPDKSKVHIWICDDNRRPQMRALADEMDVGYFDRPDNEGAKAGNLNHAMSLTSAPYIVTFDADMIPKSDFLLKTIPYFVDAEIRQNDLPEKDRLHLGFLQTPQCFYDPDVFQHALYSEKRAPNEQDFFYRTIEPAKTSSNSVIYGGSNTVLSRRALEDVGGFYTGSITEDFATGLLIEAKGYVSLGLSEPLASGQTPHTFKEHIKQRTRWGRGVIVTAKKLKIWRRKELTLSQKFSYWSSVVYWLSPIKNLVYLLSPLLYAALAVPVFRCNWLELVVFWLPLFIAQDLSLRLNSKNTISTKWSGIYETSVMAHLLIPIIKETLGFSMSKFKVTDKSGKGGRHKTDFRSMIPFLVLIVLSVTGIVRISVIFDPAQVISIIILLFWIIRNLYFLIMAAFLIDGRDSDGETVKVTDAELVSVKTKDAEYDGVTTVMTEHNMTVFLDDSPDFMLGSYVDISVSSSLSVSGERTLDLNGRTIKASGSGFSVITVGSGATLTISDNETGGKVTGGSISASGGAGITVNGGTLNLRSGAVSGNTSTRGAITESGDGIGVLNGGKLYMTGGEISGNTSYVGGGMVTDSTNTTVSVTGGVIRNNTTERFGSAIFAGRSSGSALIIGGDTLIVDNISKWTADKDGEATINYTNDALKISGNPTIYGCWKTVGNSSFCTHINLDNVGSGVQVVTLNGELSRSRRRNR